MMATYPLSVHKTDSITQKLRPLRSHLDKTARASRTPTRLTLTTAARKREDIMHTAPIKESVPVFLRPLPSSVNLAPSPHRDNVELRVLPYIAFLSLLVLLAVYIRQRRKGGQEGVEKEYLLENKMETGQSEIYGNSPPRFVSLSVNNSSNALARPSTQSVGANTIVWFRQDLRLHDNQAFHAAVREANKRGGSVVCVYIWSKDEMEKESGEASRVWLYHALQALDTDLRIKYKGAGLNFINGPYVVKLHFQINFN